MQSVLTKKGKGYGGKDCPAGADCADIWGQMSAHGMDAAAAAAAAAAAMLATRSSSC